MPFDLEAEIARRLNVSPDAVAPVLEVVIERIRKQVSHFGYARVAGLGTFRGQNGRLSFEPESVLSERVNIRFAGLEEISVEAPPLLDSDEDIRPATSSQDAESPPTVSEADELQDSSTETGVGGVFDLEEEIDRTEEEIADDEGELLEIDEGREEDDAEYGESPGEDYERPASGSADALTSDADESMQPGHPSASWSDDLEADDVAGAETAGIVWDPSRESAAEMDEAEPEESADDEDVDLEGWEDAEDEPATWLEQPREEHPLGQAAEPPFEEADFSVLDERQELTQESLEDGEEAADLDAGEGVESGREVHRDDIADEDFAGDVEAPEGAYDRTSHADVECEIDDIAPVEPEGSLAAEEDDYLAEEDDYLTYEDDYPAGEDDYPAEEDDYPAEEDDYQAEEDDYQAEEDDYPAYGDEYPAGDEDHLADDLVESDTRTPSVEWTAADAPSTPARHEHDAELGDEAGEEDVGVYAASGATASGQEGRSEVDAPEDDDARAAAAAGGAAQHERLRQPSERRHAAARAEGTGAAGGNRNAIWIGVGILVLVAAAAVVYFSMTPSVTPEGPPVTEERDAQAPVDTTAAASAEASGADESAAGTTDAAAPATPAVEDDPDPLRSSEGIDLSTGGYTLVVYSETSESGAANVMRQFREDGFRTSVLEDQEGATTRYRVGVGQFATLDEAVEARDRLAGNELPDDAWVRRIQ